MKKLFFLLIAAFLLSSCSSNEEAQKQEVPEPKATTEAIEVEEAKEIEVVEETPEVEEEYFLIKTPPVVESLKEDGTLTIKNSENFKIKIETTELFKFGDSICKNENNVIISGSASETFKFDNCNLKKGDIFSVYMITTSENYSITAEVK